MASSSATHGSASASVAAPRTASARIKDVGAIVVLSVCQRAERAVRHSLVHPIPRLAQVSISMNESLLRFLARRDQMHDSQRAQTGSGSEDLDQSRRKYDGMIGLRRELDCEWD